MQLLICSHKTAKRKASNRDVHRYLLVFTVWDLIFCSVFSWSWTRLSARKALKDTTNSKQANDFPHTHEYLCDSYVLRHLGWNTSSNKFLMLKKIKHRRCLFSSDSTLEKHWEILFKSKPSYIKTFFGENRNGNGIKSYPQ